MIFTQYYLDCLSQASYLIADEGSRQAVIVDPRRDIAEYLADAADSQLTIVGILNTHFHADFVSGHLELARETGAWIGYGEAAEADFEIRSLRDGERISLGDVQLEIMSTPGHTPESISVLVYEHADDEVAHAVLTGDALFIGDVGRPDLLASVGVTADELGKMLYDSVHHKLMGLDDDVKVFPAHGAGSACGKNLSTERQSTIGAQRTTNYACQPMSEQEFLDVVTEGQPSAPAYFGYNASLNRHEREIRETDARVPALSADEFAAAVADGAVIHDARPPQEFATAHLRGAINVPADGRMAETAGMVFTPQQRIVIVAPPGSEQETAVRFARIGFDHVLGYLAEPEEYFLTHQDEVTRSSRLTVEQADAARANVTELQLVDVRNPGEVANGMIEGARHIPLAELARRTDELDPGKPVLAYCAGGWRSSVGASLLRSRGFADVSDILGGYGAWSSVNGVEQGVCEATRRAQAAAATS
ncbi:MAG: MBL fold metallo-hydrolase [Actinomycetales bacterium]